MGLTQSVYGVENVFSACNLVIAKKGKIVAFSTPTHMSDLAHKLIYNKEFAGSAYMAIKDSIILGLVYCFG